MAAARPADTPGPGRFRCSIFGCAQVLAGALVLFVASSLLARSSLADNAQYSTAIVQPFKLVDVDGNFSMRYLFDERESTTTGSTSSEDRTTWEQELYLNTESYVYHPGFLSMHIGGGPLLVQQQLNTDTDGNSENETLFNFISSFDFLKIKPYPFTVFFSRTHPSITTSLAGRFLTRQTEYGLRGRLEESLLPVGLTYSLRTSENNGSGLGTVVDDDLDEFLVRAGKSYGQGDSINFSYQTLKLQSESGSPGLPIQMSQIETDTFGVHARNEFGKQDQMELDQRIDYIDEETLVEDALSQFESFTYYGRLDWKHRDNLRSNYRYYQRENDRDDAGSSGKGASAGASLRHGNFSYGASADVNSSSDVGFGQDRYRLTSSISYSQPTFFGSYRLSARAYKENTDQQSDAARIRMFDEALELVGTTAVPLRNEFVVSESVIVRNVPKTQVFTEGLDYRLVIVGSTTSIQRLINGSIADEQTVLVEYEYETGGTVEYDTIGQNYSASIGFLDNYSAYVSFSNTSNTILAGEPTISLNSMRSLNAGGRADFDIGKQLKLGGELLYTDQNEEISPFTREEVAVYVEYQFTFPTRARLSVGRVATDNEFTDEDIDADRVSLSVNSRLPWNASFNYNGSYIRDRGGTIPRMSNQHALNAQWNYRRMRISLRARFVDERMGDTSRDHLNVQVMLERFF